VAGLLHRYPDIAGVGDPGRWGLIHRLDRDTSGAILVARDQDTYQALVADLRRRQVRRVYLALVHGLVGSPTGTIEAPIGRDPTRPMRRAIRQDGKPARTHYEVMALYPEADCSLLRVRLETGRTHQIRVHLASIGHPIVGDMTYDPRPRRTGAPRTFLHASELGFTHPATGEHLDVASPLPPDLQGVIDAIG
jgi:23S rRNA pseudouridine1911/1915/1917 synthase